jgi:hypothetical protein
MPTHTPSPHRFLASRPPSTPQLKEKPKAQSNLRHGFTVQTPKPTFSSRTSTETQIVTPARRFVIAPVQKTLCGGTQRNEDEVWAQTRETPRAKLARKLKRVESIEEASQSSPPEPQSDEAYEDDVVPSIEQPSTHGKYQGGQHQDEQEEDEDVEMLFEAPQLSPRVHKRRRLSPADPTSPSRPQAAISTFAIPQQTPRTPAPVQNTHRFLTPAPRTPQLFRSTTPATTTITTSTPGPSRPQFLLPPQQLSPPKLSTPLPETFSPSRKGQRYIPGGLASTLQTWIVETANTGYAAQTRDAVTWGREKEDGVRMKVRVSTIRSGSEQRDGEEAVECYPGGVVLVSGGPEAGAGSNSYAPRASSVVDNGVVRLMLAGQGCARGAGGVRVGIGSLLGVRAPMWDVDISGEKWIVGVDWLVL